MLSSVTVDQAKCSAAGAAYCASLDPRPVGVCIPTDYSSQPEVANGIDDNCDGVYLDDERCDDIDSDGDGRVDEAPGSCLERHFFVPVCWVGGNQQDFTDVVERWERFMQERTLLNHCGIDTGSFGTKKIWYEAADINTIPCPPEWTTSDQVSAWSLLPALKDYYDLRDWDYVSFARSTRNCSARRTMAASTWTAQKHRPH